MRHFMFSVSIKDLKVQTFTSGGPGGQHQNRVETGVRLVHLPSGAVGESRSEKSQHRNKRLALRHLATSTRFQAWVRMVAAELFTGKTLDQRVDEMMTPDKIRIEIKDDKLVF